MRAFLQVFSLELKALVRSKTLATLLAFAVAWMLLLPTFLHGDGTAEGGRELLVRFSLGGVFLLALVALLASATGSLAHERTAKRLQLTMVRPVRYFAIVVGKILAHVTVGAVVLAVACALLSLRADLSRPCNHVLSPILPSVREEAKSMYEIYMKDPQTPDAVRKAKREVVLRILENKAADHYQTVPTNATAKWSFPVNAVGMEPTVEAAVRMRFAAQFDTRQDVRGTFCIGALRASVSNITQAVVTVPLARSDEARADWGVLSFRNEGREPLMLRTRKDLNVLLSADGFGWNLFRAYLVLVSILAFVIACGLFLSAGLGRPVALFVAFVTLSVSELAPSVIEQCPEELGANVTDRIGLAITRVVQEVTRPVSAVSPIEALSKDECVEPETVCRQLVTGLFLLPLLLSLAAAFVLPRKQSDLE